MTDHLVNDNAGKRVPPNTMSLWDQPAYVPPKDENARDGSDDHKEIPSLGFETWAECRNRGHK